MNTPSQPQRKRRGRKSRTKTASQAASSRSLPPPSSSANYSSSNSRNPRLRTTTLPASIGITGNSNALDMRAYTGPRLSDASIEGAITCRGTALWGSPLTPSITSNGLFSGYGTWAFVMSEWGRLASIADLFTYYRVRQLRITFVPTSGTATAGIWALNLNDGGASEDTSVGDNPQLGVVAQFPNSVYGPLWQPISSSFTYNGPKVWNTKTDGVSNVEIWQIDMMSTGLNLELGTVYGYAYAEYVIDFLLPSSTAGSPAFSVRSTGDAYKAMREEKRRVRLAKEAIDKLVNCPKVDRSVDLPKETAEAKSEVKVKDEQDYILVPSSYLPYFPRPEGHPRPLQVTTTPLANHPNEASFPHGR